MTEAEASTKDAGRNITAIESIASTLHRLYPVGESVAPEDRNFNVSRHISILLTGAIAVCRRVGMTDSQITEVFEASLVEASKPKAKVQ